jgi:ribose transport system substrate-binding protein
MLMTKHGRTAVGVTAALISAALIAGCSTSATSSDASGSPGPASSAANSEVADDTVIDKFGLIEGTYGPAKEAPTPATSLTLTPEQVTQVKAAGYKAAILWHEMSGWSQAVQDGMVAQLDELGIEITSKADAKFDAATQANQIETALATKPSVILGQAVDPATGAAAYQPAVDAGVKLIFADQAPNAYTHGKEYQAIITDDLYQAGKRTGEAMCAAVGNKGEVAIMFYDADFHVTNFRDAAFQQTLRQTCPDVKIVAKEGFSDPNKAEEIANGIIARHPEVAGIYTSWAVPAQGVLAALKSAGNTTTKIVTIDLDDTMATDMASPDGHTAAIIVDQAYNYGKAMAISAALALLGQPAPAYGIVDEVTATRDTLTEGYAAWNQKVPDPVNAALGS